MRMGHANKAFRLPVPALVWIVSVLGIGPWLDTSLPGTGLLDTGAVALAAQPDRGPSATVAVARFQPAPPIVDPLPTLDRPPIVDPRPTLQPPPCRFADETTEPDADGEWALAIVDTALRLPSGYVPDDLVPVSRSGLRGGGLIRALVLPDLHALARAARAAGVPLTAYSAYRSEARQAAAFNTWVRAYGVAAARRGSARPGHSEHELGTTLDLGSGAVAPWTTERGADETGRWLAAHAAEFGFVASYPEGASDATCYDAEWWHVRWVGRDRAAAVAASGLTLRAWLWQQEGDPGLGSD